MDINKKSSWILYFLREKIVGTNAQSKIIKQLFYSWYFYNNFSCLTSDNEHENEVIYRELVNSRQPNVNQNICETIVQFKTYWFSVIF